MPTSSMRSRVAKAASKKLKSKRRKAAFLKLASCQDKRYGSSLHEDLGENAGALIPSTGDSGSIYFRGDLSESMNSNIEGRTGIHEIQEEYDSANDAICATEGDSGLAERRKATEKHAWNSFAPSKNAGYFSVDERTASDSNTDSTISENSWSGEGDGDDCVKNDGNSQNDLSPSISLDDECSDNYESVLADASNMNEMSSLKSLKKQSCTSWRSPTRHRVRPLDLSKIIASQREILGTRLPPTLHAALQKKAKRISHSNILENASGAKTLEERWEILLNSLDDDFFTSSEARLSERGRVSQGKKAYEGLRITPLNNEDLKEIYECEWEPKARLGQPTSTFDQFRICAGQFSRFAVASGIVRASELYEKGSLLRCTTKKAVAEAFVGYFQLRASANTVMCKALHLVKLSEYASRYLKRTGEAVAACEAERTGKYLRSIASAHKTEGRRQAREKKSINMRLEQAGLLLPGDLEMLSEQAFSSCKHIILTAKSYLTEDGEQGVEKLFDEKPALLSKWCLNFLSMLMLAGGGQRPQVYTQLQLPTADELQMQKTMAKENGFFELKCVFEKSTRSVDTPNVIFPSSVFPFLQFHTRYARNIVRKIAIRKGTGSEGADPGCLILDSRDGHILKSSQITSSFKKFVRRFDPEIPSSMTTMNLRASFATMSLQEYRAGKVFKGLKEDEFLSNLAKVMNTSVEQLQNTYASSYGRAFKELAAEVAHLLDSTEEQSTMQEDILDL